MSTLADSTLLPTDIIQDESLARLERDLRARQVTEETNKSALRQLHQELKEAYFKIAQQQAKLDTLVKKVRASRGQDDTSSSAGTSEDQPAMPCRLADLAHPDNFCRKLLQEFTLGHPSTQARPVSFTNGAAATRIADLWKSLPGWTKGAISTEDAAFLDRIIDDVRPNKVYEVGVASGASSALILSSMAEYSDPAHVWLHSYDISQFCYFDQTHAVGDATRTMVPHLLEHWELNARATALDLPRGRDAKSLYFIDANHVHPWPALDLIALLPGLKTGDHVVLHDTNLPTMSGGKFPAYGVQFLFEDWLGERLSPDVSTPNIGAIVIPEDKNMVLASLVKTLSKPWPLQLADKDYHLQACEQLLQAFVRENKLS